MARKAVYRYGREFWRLYDRAIRSGAVRKEGTALIVWKPSQRSKHPCICPTFCVRIVGIKRFELAERDRWMQPNFPDLIAARQREWHNREGRDSATVLGFIEIWGRCRKCSECQAYRRELWLARIVAECGYCRGRTWFVTLTCNQKKRDALLYASIAAAKAEALNWHELPADDRQGRLFKLFYKDVQKYVKRVREDLRVKGKRRLRYFAVLEPHKDGMPHCHLLVHEESLADANERVFRRKWHQEGFAQAKLVNSPREAGAYVSKYLTKRAIFIRASQLYGRSEPQPLLQPSEA